MAAAAEYLVGAPVGNHHSLAEENDPVREAGGRHFSTEVARITGGRALLPDEGARLLGRDAPLDARVGGAP